MPTTSKRRVRCQLCGTLLPREEALSTQEPGQPPYQHADEYACMRVIETFVRRITGHAPSAVQMHCLKFRCHYCDAAPHTWCTTRAGALPGQRAAGELHMDRYDQLNLEQGHWAPPKTKLEYF